MRQVVEHHGALGGGEGEPLSQVMAVAAAETEPLGEAVGLVIELHDSVVRLEPQEGAQMMAARALAGLTLRVELVIEDHGARLRLVDEPERLGGGIVLHAVANDPHRGQPENPSKENQLFHHGLFARSEENNASPLANKDIRCPFVPIH